jgi:hypothetical protein
VQLAATGVLGLDDPLSHWVPRIPGARRITLRQLLDQTSGLDDYVTDGRFLAAERRRGPEFEWTPRQLLRYVPAPLAAPGERWNYSNTGSERCSLETQPRAACLGRWHRMQPYAAAGSLSSGGRILSGTAGPGARRATRAP